MIDETESFFLSEDQHAYTQNAHWILPYNIQAEDAVAYLAYATEEQPESKETLVFGKNCEEVVPSILVVRLYKDYDQSSEGWPELRIPQIAIHEDSEVYKEGDSGMLVLKRDWAQKHNWFIDEEEDDETNSDSY